MIVGKLKKGHVVGRTIARARRVCFQGVGLGCVLSCLSWQGGVDDIINQTHHLNTN